MTPTQLFRAAVQTDRTRQTCQRLDRFTMLDRRAAMRALRRNVRDADTRNECSVATRDAATRMLYDWYLQERDTRDRCRIISLTE
jgi:hypothetical protein